MFEQQFDNIPAGETKILKWFFFSKLPVGYPTPNKLN
jgi:hypothetical protein